MEESAYELEVITPLIIKGAEDYELRVPSIKGVMRFWFRAMMGCLVENTEDLYKIESSIFGGQEVKSDVAIKLENQNLTIVKDSQFYDKYKYLLFAHRQDKGSLSYLKEKTPFNILVYTKDDSKQDIVKAVFELISLFGGFGQRTRRGFGSVMLKNFTIKDEDDFVDKFKSIYKKFDNYLNKFEEEYLKNHPELKFIRGNNKKRDFSTFCGGKFCFVKNDQADNYLFESLDLALKALEEKWKAFRTERKHNNDKIYFGLPIGTYHHQYPNAGSRRASPILFKVLKINEGKFALVSTFLNAEKFLGNDGSLDLENVGIIKEFFEYIGDKKWHDFCELMEPTEA